ncbi:MAG: hypothetical protein QOD24_4322 [Solirubrobacteraceae bacterium]|jgi:hypothetical protein|nr:hypothetical protein [Solirubrobacteraceae bacterium]
MILPIAHAGHWIADLLYVLPLAIALGFLGFQSMRDKRRDEAERTAKPADDAPPA